MQAKVGWFCDGKMTESDLVWARSDWCRLIRQELKAQGPALFSPHHNHNHIFTLLLTPLSPSQHHPLTCKAPVVRERLFHHQLADCPYSGCSRMLSQIVGLLFRNWQWEQKQDENPSIISYAFGWFVPVTTIMADCLMPRPTTRKGWNW